MGETNPVSSSRGNTGILMIFKAKEILVSLIKKRLDQLSIQNTKKKCDKHLLGGVTTKLRGFQSKFALRYKENISQGKIIFTKK